MWLWLLVTLAMGQEKICYSSGLTLLVDTIKGSQTMTVTTVIEGGSSGEDDDQQGAAHLAEHLWFRSSTDGGPSVDVLLHQMGASVNGYTSWDETVYVTMAPADALRSVLALEARRLRDPLAGTEAVFEAERSVV